MVLLKTQRYRNGVLHVSASRSDSYRVVLRNLLEGRSTTTATSHHDSCQRANEKQK